MEFTFYFTSINPHVICIKGFAQEMLKTKEVWEGFSLVDTV